MKPNKDVKFIYLASPYSHKDKGIQLQRALDIDNILAALYRDTKHAFFPPILVSRIIKDLLGNKIGTSFKVWADVDLCVIKHCDEVWVATLKGWRESIGVTAEIEFANKHKIPVKYIYFDKDRIHPLMQYAIYDRDMYV